MTPDRFIAAAFREIRPSVVDDAVHYRRTVLDRAAELARESVGDGELLPCPWCGEKLDNASVSEGSTFRWRKVDGCCADGPEVRHNTMADDQAAAEEDSKQRAITAWNTRAREVDARRSAGGDVERDAARYRWLRQYNIDSYLANGKLEVLDAAIDAALAGVSEGKE